MDFYRVKQFYWAINSKLTEEDVKFIKRNLNKQELSLFIKLTVSEQKHSINVAYDVQEVCKLKNVNSHLLIKAALLHDIGKIVIKLNVIDKSIMVIADSVFKGQLKNFSNIKKINVYYNHNKIGKKILEDYNEEERLLYLVENHNNFEIKNDVELEILRQCDSRN